MLGAGDARAIIPRAAGLVLVKQDKRLVVLWSGREPRDGGALPEALASHALASVELSGAIDHATARQRLDAVCS